MTNLITNSPYHLLTVPARTCGMVCSVLPVAFADAARQAQYEALRQTLAAADDVAVLLGNLAAFAPVAADALLVRPDGIVWLSLTPRGGLLTVPADPAHPWLLDGQPLPNGSQPNPLAAFLAQQPLALAWLAGQLGRPVALLPPCRGLALLEAPLSFGPEVEAHLDAAGADFELLGDVSRLLARLRQPPVSARQRLPTNELLAWGQQLAGALSTPVLSAENIRGINGEEISVEESPADWLRRQLRQLWRWLGAEDVPADPPYGSAPPPPGPDPRQEAQLRQLRQELQAELRQQAALQAAAHRQHLAALRQQLALPPLSTAELADARAAGAAVEAAAQRAAQEAALHAAQTELASRNRELDVRIQQLGQLVAQLQAPTAPLWQAPETTPPAVPPAAPAGRLVWQARWLRPAGRLALAGLAVAAAGAGIWQVGRSSSKSALQPPAAATLANGRTDSLRRAEAGLNNDFITTDSALITEQTDRIDTATQRLIPGPALPDAAPTDPQLLLAPLVPARADSTAPAVWPTSPPTFIDSATSPAP